MILYKRNSNGKPVSWDIKKDNNKIIIYHGLVGGKILIESFQPERNIDSEISSRIKQKRKEGYKYLFEIYDNAPNEINDNNIKSYLETYLPRFNTTENDFILPMLCKTLESNKPFTKNDYGGQWKINGLRCLIGAVKTNDLFHNYKFIYQSREGIIWSLPFMDELLYNIIPTEIIDMLIDYGAYLDGEIYLPGYTVNEINSFVKNNTTKQHKLLQFWCYDIAVPDMIYSSRRNILLTHFNKYISYIRNKNQHYNNVNRFVLLEETPVNNIETATTLRDNFVSLGFEGIVVRNYNTEYGYDKRNVNMMKYKPLYDGKFVILDIIPEGVRRSNLPKFICKNDINEGTFEATIKGSFSEQEQYLINKDKYIGKLLFIEYRERSGVKNVPFHAKAVKIID